MKSTFNYLENYLKSILGRFTILLVFLALMNKPGLAQYASYGLPDTVIPACVGVNTHFTTGGTIDHDMIKTAGIKVIRQDFFWYLIETTVRGQYNWGPYDSLLQELDQRGIRCLATLNLNDTLYAPTTRTAPTDSANIAAFAKFAAAAAARYKNSHCIWELWNEPNGKNTWKPVENAAQYAAFALVVCKAIKAADSTATIVAPAMAGVHTDYLDTLFQAGLLNYVDGITIHPYRDGPPPQLPETVASPVQSVQALIAKYLPAGKKIFVVSGEWGYSTCSTTQGVSLQSQADYFARMNLYNLYLGIPLTIWYDWKNDGTDLTQLGQNRGLVTASLDLKPSYIAAMTLTCQLSGYAIYSRYSTGNSSDVVLVLKDSTGNVKLAAWTQGSAHNVTFNLPAVSFPDTVKKVWWVSNNADTGSINVSSNSFTLQLSSKPFYYSYSQPEPISVAAPYAPTLGLPASNSVGILRMPILSWIPPASLFAINYRIQVASDSSSNPDGSFKTQSIVLDSALADTSLEFSQTLSADTKYFWHVQAINLGGSGAYSPANNFTTGTLVAPPSTPPTVSPVQLANGVSRNPNFVWLNAEYAEKYHIQIANEYYVYTKGDSAGMFYSQDVVFDSVLTDTTLHLTALLDSSTTYFWHVNAINTAGSSGYSTTIRFTTGSLVDAVDGLKGVPKSYMLYQNFPNPFNPSTIIQYDLPKSSHVAIKVYDILGREVADLVNSNQASGKYRVVFNASKYASGIYLLRMSAGSYANVRKIMLIK